jgi:predicted AAA+ superfamily ATPase
MKQIKRLLKINLSPGQSAFLWGARKVGKSTYLKANFPQSLYFDFLKTDLFLELTKRPFLLREQILAQNRQVLSKPIILDEVQKIPHILDEVHWLIENKKLSFILCGSSARKLKRGKANLLGGRAWRFEMFPLVSKELPSLNLLKILNQGTIPSHFLGKNPSRSLKGYIEDYLKEEVFAEGLTRNIPAFSRFFEAMGYSHGELTNFANIARDSGIDAKTVKEYYQILVDTLLGTFVEPYKKKHGRDIILKTPKFYLFDVGVAGAITKRAIKEERGFLFGQAFEHFIFTELRAFKSYSELNFRINYWRTKTGLEVDFVLGEGQVAIEVKGATFVKATDLRGIRAFLSEYKPKKAIVVCNEFRPRIVDQSINILPWRDFLDKLWSNKIISNP